jgi:UDP-N-acetylglucosamine acyltransferase
MLRLVKEPGLGQMSPLWKVPVLVSNCKIFPGAVISAIPQDLKYDGEETTVEIGRQHHH